ncbi:bifunctional diguanylate cyclase/phosphodiesterase [Blastococcus sp. TF02A-35]|uniref:putative bifunctional diguanylate cyclase/phosphodiesterase n=1 Tax=Blastococcus sp. TF02A-35 TaxID=2559612 RepID=UPI0010730DEC|nr:bifunctional diguanylate cyclase/phosphodiesterase [Blastococcus sp. TF02A_35]TFV51918.1 bifunctional diguanylate cyclase/phosphodiesterase [Blastococcus sp. TF02A_35]
MQAALRARLLPGAPVLTTALVVVAGVAGLFVGTGRLEATSPSGTGPLRVLLTLVLHGSLLALLVWRARAVVHERPVWLRIAAGAVLVAGSTLLGPLLGLVPAAQPFATAANLWAPVLAFPPVYGGLVRWNRFSSNLADPNDTLNGASAVLAVVAVIQLVTQVGGGPLASAPAATALAVGAHFAVSFVILGTVATLPFLGDMGRDPRTWLVLASFGATLAGSTAVLLAGGSPDTWAWVTEPVAVVCLALAAVLRPGRSEPQPADPTASTIGAFVVIVASTGVLLVASEAGVTGATAWCAALAATGSGVRLLVNVRELAVLAITRREAHTDELTGLANRRALLRRVEELGRTGTPLALALLDLDKFKEVNDALGHAAGDDLLRKVAARLETVLRPGDVLARLGGDEFAVLAPMDADAPLADAALSLGRRLHQRLAEPFPIEGMVIHSSASVGLTVSGGGEDDVSPAELLREADVAMYDAKRTASGAALYDSSRHAGSSGNLALVEDLRAALAGDQLVLHHQPQLDVATGRSVGVEALVRWQHPVRGLLGPGEFLPLAEVHGLMGQLTEVVLGRAVAQAADWHRRGLDLRMSVNLSASNLLDITLPGRVAALLAEHGLPAGHLILEVTESVLLTDPDRSIAVVRSLADLGACVSIDDFGTGYSSLAYLRDLPVGELKLDRSFTADLLTDERTAAIVASTVELAHRLGLRVVAEGVETPGTFTHLRSLDCDLSQGYLHSRPLPADQLEEWLAAFPAEVPQLR